MRRRQLPTRRKVWLKKFILADQHCRVQGWAVAFLVVAAWACVKSGPCWLSGSGKADGSMTISMTDYFRDRKSDRKKETRYINVINKDNCTSCNSCANVCPVDCIYEVVSPVPSESYHQIDTSRCIGCQMCYRSPNDSSEFYQLTICPWNAIDMLHNPNSKPDDVSVLQPYYRGTSADLPWPKLEEYGYQLFLDGEVFLPASEKSLHRVFQLFQEQSWMYSEEDNVQIVQTVAEEGEGFVRYRATEEGRELLDCMYKGWKRIFMD